MNGEQSAGNREEPPIPRALHAQFRTHRLRRNEQREAAHEGAPARDHKGIHIQEFPEKAGQSHQESGRVKLDQT